ncbi:MAG: trehalose-phosphatase [Actinomycetota bacterium]
MEIEEALAFLRSQPERTGIFLDFDGTLAPIVPDPLASRIVAGASDTLGGLADRYRIVAMISGRRAGDLFRRVGAPAVRYFGVYGAEEMTPLGLRQHPKAGSWRRSARVLADQAAEVIETHHLIGCQVEYKDVATSVHYRQTGQPEPPEELMNWARAAAARSGFQAGSGRKVVELRPAAASKAGTFLALARTAGISNALVAGDDEQDVAMIRAARDLLGGAVVGIGMRSAEEPDGLASVTDVQLDTPAELAALLSRLLVPL